MKYEIKHLKQDEVEAFFADVKANNHNPIIDLDSGVVTTCAAGAGKLNRDHEDYLVLEHTTLEKAQKWWDDLRRVDYAGATYTIIQGEQRMTENTFYGLGINSVDKRLYKMVWQAQPAIVEPLVDPEHSSLILEPEPICDWAEPISVELAE